MAPSTTKNKRINIWQYQFILTRRLAWWGVMSFVLGIPLFLMEPLLRGFSVQATVWGILLSAIAVGGAMWISKRRGKLTDPAAKEIVEQETNKLRRRLWWVVVVEGLFVITGLVLAFTWGRKDAWWLGTGWGVVVQGLFLLGFAWYHAKKVPVN